MITNKNRKHFIESALLNFKEQTYPNKVLIVINHSPEEKLITVPHPNVHEFVVDKSQQHFSLGGLRNIALDGFVPEGGLWTTYDDDDIRAKDYLEQLCKRIVFHGIDLLFLKNRLEYNINNGFVYRSQFKTGMPFFVAKKYTGFKYLEVDTLEDVRVGQDYQKAGKKVAKFNNDPKLYVRVIHNTNTSAYVRNDKNSIVEYDESTNYHEFEATQEEKEYATSMVTKRLKHLLPT
jgi:glycosyltransferase involved in cell wall biosynthesis